MRGCLKVVALLMAILFVLTAVPAFFVYNMARVATDREAVKEALNGQVLLGEVATAIIRQAVQEQVTAQGLPPAVQNSAAIQQAVENLVPADWAASQTNGVIDSVFNYLETGDESALTISLDMAPLYNNLRGEPGRQIVLSVLQTLPACTTEQVQIDPQTGQVNIPGCIPAGIDPQLIAGQVHAAVVAILDQNPQVVGQANTITFNLLDERNPGAAEARQGLQRARQLYNFARRWSWVVWLIPLMFISLTLLFGARSFSGLGHWLGWPLLIAAGITLILSLAPFLFELLFGLVLNQANMGEAGAVAGRFVEATLGALMDILLGRVRLQAAVMLLAGFFWVGVGLVMGWMFARPQEQVVTY
jgi:hypothetical protein